MIEQLESFPIGSRIRIIYGQLEGATGVVSMISADEFKYYLTIDGTVGGVYVTVSSDVLTMDVGVTEDIKKTTESGPGRVSRETKKCRAFARG